MRSRRGGTRPVRGAEVEPARVCWDNSLKALCRSNLISSCSGTQCVILKLLRITNLNRFAVSDS